MNSKSSFALEDGLDLRKLLTTGSILHINEDHNDADSPDIGRFPAKTVDFIGKPVESFAALESTMIPLNATGPVKKKIMEEGGGLPLHKGCTVYLAFSGYWENEPEPFVTETGDKPLIIDLNDNGLLPGIQMAVESMLVGEVSVFLLPYEVMYGELGNLPRIKPKSNCVFYIKLIKSILTAKEGKLDLSEPNMFQRVYHEVKLLYGSGVTLYKTNNCPAALQLFRKAVYMLHTCRLADEHEEKKQENMLKKIYTNLAICYNLNRQPLKACIACNELKRLNSLWNNGKVLFQNAKALRMIGQFDAAQKKLQRAKKLCPESKDIDAEFDLLRRTWDSCNQSTLMENAGGHSMELVSPEFQQEVDKLIKNFKENVDLCKLTLPGGLNSEEISYIKEACLRENLFFTKIQKDFALDKDKKSQTKTEDDDLMDELQNDEFVKF